MPNRTNEAAAWKDVDDFVSAVQGRQVFVAQSSHRGSVHVGLVVAAAANIAATNGDWYNATSTRQFDLGPGLGPLHGLDPQVRLQILLFAPRRLLV
jgi:hypothetical protein